MVMFMTEEQKTTNEHIKSLGYTLIRTLIEDFTVYCFYLKSKQKYLVIIYPSGYYILHTVSEPLPGEVT